jgi:hypothetical protein
MAVVLRFTFDGLTTDKYKKITDRLETVGAGTPEGRLYHICFGDPNNLMISDIWESRQAFDRFGETVMPICREFGVEPSEPTEFQVHNVIEGTRTKAAER